MSWTNLHSIFQNEDEAYPMKMMSKYSNCCHKSDLTMKQNIEGENNPSTKTGITSFCPPQHLYQLYWVLHSNNPPPPGKNTPRYIYFSHNNQLSFLLKVDYINSNGEQINVPHQHKHNYISGPYISITEQYKLLNHRPICFLTSAPLNQHPICTISNAKSESGTMKISGRKQRRYRGPITRKWRVYKWSSTIKKSTRNTNQSKEFQPRSARIKQMHG